MDHRDPFPLLTQDASEGEPRPGHTQRQRSIEVLAYVGGSVAFLVTLVIFARATFQDFVVATKTAEATHELGTLSKLQVDAYARGRTQPGGPALCKSAPHPVPEKFSWVQNSKYTSRVEDWRQGAPDEGFRCLGFEIEGMQHYQYDFASTGSRGKFTAWARGDLDGNGVTAELAQYGEVDPTTQTVVLAKSLHKVRPGE
jgi:hypothetical protein